MIFKRFIAFILAAVAVFALSACGGATEAETETGTGAAGSETESAAATLEGSCADIIAKVYENIAPDSVTAEFMAQLINKEVNAENELDFLGVTGIPYSEAIASESMIQPHVYSFMVLRIKEGEDVEEARLMLKNNLNLSKWVCMSAEKSVIIKHGDVIMAVMSTEEVCAEVEAAIRELIK